MTTAADVFEAWVSGVEWHPGKVTLSIGEFDLSIESNSATVLQRLRDYFAPFQAETGEREGEADVTVHLVQAPGRVPGFEAAEFVDWKREPGKVGRKDAIRDLSDGRVVLKVRTGMQFLQHDRYRVGIGPCETHESQLINFILSQYMNWLQQRGSLIGHAAAAVVDGQAVAIAGLSGGGKSSLMLRLLDDPTREAAFLTNDRLFVERLSQDREPVARGIPKMPRVNPGTILSMTILHRLIPEARREILAGLPGPELWELEEKHDVRVDEVFGIDRLCLEAPLSGLVILNWNRQSERACRCDRVDLRDRQDLLPAVMKSPGPFFQDRESRFITAETAHDPDAYLEALDGVATWEMTGKIDFDLALDQLAAAWPPS